MVKAEDVLADNQNFFIDGEGRQIRKGTVAATIFNAKAIEGIIDQPASEAKKKRLEEILSDVRALIPALQAVQLFEFFTPLEWLKNDADLKEGRTFVVVLYLQHYPQAVSAEIRSLLSQLKGCVSPELQKEIEKALSCH
ncbi:DUF7709 family protein [Candidatus Protochlamydia phocaeensis]|uniref:DUF7709 family protein n=1 Tax=Candidatus Protochlamydia phocaeensis TaxID=1414722 RepID=UPI000839AF05|nr:hypothetical protein [Candidatus Protochlamydia phocaeensis]